ncbi:MAG TPA: adenylate kinase [Dehalococcoidia bacterium]|nr:adenylate kinase [Dehalococcoidia bacterium]
MYLILLGLPGAGKGTQAALISEAKGMAHITSGGLFRENISKQTELGRQVQPYVEGGLLVPDRLTIGMLLERIGQPDAARGFILDGFPRNLEQARALDEALAGQGKAIDKALYVNVSPEELVRRLSGRWNCRQCGAVYHEQSMPPKAAGVCDRCGGELYQREDDKPDVVRRRLDVNTKETEPLLDYYRQAGKLVEVDGELPVEEVRDRLLAAMARPQEVR